MANAEKEHAHRATRIGLWALGIGFGAFMLWAAFAPLDEGVPSQGHIAIDTKRRPVQHLTGGILKQVLVGEGDIVKEGQLLVKLDDASAKANFESIRQRYLGLRAMQGRLMAEQAGQSRIQFHPDLQAAASDPLILQQMNNQEQLLQSRQSALRADLQAIEENIQGQEISIQTLESILQNRKSQQALITEELNNTRNLVKDGYAPRNRQLELERVVSESNSALSDTQGNILRAKRSIAEFRQRAISRKQEYRKEVESQMADITREVLGDAERFRAVQDDWKRTEIHAPAAGQVVSLVTPASGAIIGAGQKLMDIVPTNQPLMLETKILPNMIDRVQTGMAVDVRFSSFSHTPQLVVDGKVLSVSSDVLVDAATQQPYFLARVTVTPEGLKTLGKRQMQPGMPVEVVFKTGERSLLTYLLNPLTKRIAASMKEE
ncbi:MAG: hypothetical protein RIR79_503 [Pseudomonadota bacterium]|jgi:protease secretion system membrane fusion protein